MGTNQMGSNLCILLKNSVDMFPDKLALRSFFQSWTYHDLWHEVGRISNGFDHISTPARTHVGIFLPNCVEYTLFYYGVHASGRVIIPINPMLKPEELAIQLDDGDVHDLVTIDALLPTVSKAFALAPKLKRSIHKIVLIDGLKHHHDQLDPLEIDPDQFITHKQLVHDQKALNSPFPTQPQDTAVILYTSGTTGKPKGAELSHANLISNVETLKSLHPKITALSWNALLALPLFHSFGQTVIQNTTLALGGSMMVMERYDPWQVAQWIETHKITVFAGVPTMYYGLLHHPSITAQMLKTLQLCLCGGAPMPEDVMKRFDETFHANIVEAYGLSETSPVASINPPFATKKMGSIGKPIPNVEFRLIDGQDQIIESANITGELYIKGPNVMKGYYKKPAETAEALQNGWFKTGDLAERDTDGFYRLVDRAKDLIIRGGFNVYPREIEERLHTHPDVIEAAVVGISDDRLGEEVCGYVSLRPGAKTTEQDLVEFCREHLAAYKYPRQVHIVDSLPKGPTGKILKRVLRDQSAPNSKN